MAETFQDNKIATGWGNAGNLINIEAIAVGGVYYLTPDDLSGVQPGKPYVDGDGITQYNGFPIAIWFMGSMNYAQYWNIRNSATIHDGALSAKVTVRTRVSEDSTTYANYNAIGSIPVIAAVRAVTDGVPRLVWTFSRLEAL